MILRGLDPPGDIDTIGSSQLFNFSLTLFSLIAYIKKARKIKEITSFFFAWIYTLNFKSFFFIKYMQLCTYIQYSNIYIYIYIWDTLNGSLISWNLASASASTLFDGFLLGFHFVTSDLYTLYISLVIAP